MGRPPKDPEEKTTKQVGVRLTDAEQARLQSLAVELRVTAGEVMRRGLNELYERVFAKRKRGE